MEIMTRVLLFKEMLSKSLFLVLQLVIKNQTKKIVVYSPENGSLYLIHVGVSGLGVNF